MDTNELRRLAAEVDEEHRAAMRDLPDQLAAEISDADAATKASRRSVLRRLGFAGAAIGTTAAALPAMARMAAAQESTTTSAAAATTTTTLPPKKSTPEDVAVYTFAQSLELAAAVAYEAAAATGILTGDVLRVAATFGSHHLQHAQAFAGLAGKAATGVANQTVLAKFAPLIQKATTPSELLTVAFDLENVAASTYTAALGQLVGTDGAAVVASIQPIENRHALVLGQALELEPTKYLIPFVTTDDAVDPADYPIISR